MIGGSGRTDFPGGDAGLQYDAVIRRLFTLPDETVVWPAHDYRGKTSSTIGDEKATNPFLRTDSPELSTSVRARLPQVPVGDAVALFAAVRGLKDRF